MQARQDRLHGFLYFRGQKKLAEGRPKPSFVNHPAWRSCLKCKHYNDGQFSVGEIKPFAHQQIYLALQSLVIHTYGIFGRWGVLSNFPYLSLCKYDTLEKCPRLYAHTSRICANKRLRKCLAFHRELAPPTFGWFLISLQEEV